MHRLNSCRARVNGVYRRIALAYPELRVTQGTSLALDDVGHRMKPERHKKLRPCCGRALRASRKLGRATSNVGIHVCTQIRSHAGAACGRQRGQHWVCAPGNFQRRFGACRGSSHSTLARSIAALFSRTERRTLQAIVLRSIRLAPAFPFRFGPTLPLPSHRSHPDAIRHPFRASPVQILREKLSQPTERATQLSEVRGNLRAPATGLTRGWSLAHLAPAPLRVPSIVAMYRSSALARVAAPIAALAASAVSGAARLGGLLPPGFRGPRRCRRTLCLRMRKVYGRVLEGVGSTRERRAAFAPARALPPTLLRSPAAPIQCAR